MRRHEKGDWMGNTPSRMDEEEIRKINRLQRDYFSGVVRLFDPPLPKGVPERLEKIVSLGRVGPGDLILDVGTGTGILIPLIEIYRPGKIYACDLSKDMLARLEEKHPDAHTILADARDLSLPDATIDVVFVNACYSNIADKVNTFENISRMMTKGGRLVISHPMGKGFIELLKKKAPFPLDDFPGRSEAEVFLGAFQFAIADFIDQADLYVLVACRH
jgi:SAM-dependent methyltransferase